MNSQRNDWKEIPGWPGYRVSSDGVVQSCKDNAGVLTESWSTRTLFIDKDGYRKLSLHHRKRHAFVGVHVLVLTCHGPQRPPGPAMGLHNNGDTSDNRIENLRWGFADDNADDRERHLRARHEHGKPSKLTAGQVLEIRKLRAETDLSLSDLARKFSVSKKAILNVVHGRTWRCLEGSTSP